MLPELSPTMEANRLELGRMLRAKSYQEGDFLLSSGKRSTFYLDCRITSLSARGSLLIGSLFNYLLSPLEIQGVGGMTLGADPLVSAVTTLSNSFGRPLNGLLVRKEAKGHGTNKYVEGMANFAANDNVAMLEDVVTTGHSLLLACDRVRGVGLQIAAVCAIVDREEGGREALAQAGYNLIALFTLQELKDLAV